MSSPEEPAHPHRSPNPDPPANNLNGHSLPTRDDDDDDVTDPDPDPDPDGSSTITPAAAAAAAGGGIIERRVRPSRACTLRSAARLCAAAAAEADPEPVHHRRPRASKKPRRSSSYEYGEEANEEEEEEAALPRDKQCSGGGGRFVTQLVSSPPHSLLPRWSLRSMWEFAAILNFLHVFRSLLNISVEFSAEELETALITPNDTLSDIHVALLKVIPPITRMALGRKTWVTVLCRKLRDWWHWVADGEIPIVASHGVEVDIYNETLDPGVRVVILKALCDIRAEQEDIRNYIDSSIKLGVQLSTFRKERVGGDSHGISYWYEDDPIIGHRLYREIKKVEVKKEKKGVHVVPTTSLVWETVATNLDEFQEVSEKLFSSNNRTEVSLGKKLKINMLPEVEKVHKTKERLLKKQHRQALLLDSLLNMDGLASGRSLRNRKPVTYTFDDFDRSINEAIKVTKRKQSSPEPTVIVRREHVAKPDASTNGKWGDSTNNLQHLYFSELSPNSLDFDDDMDEEQDAGLLGRSVRKRQRPQRYSTKEFVEAVSEYEADFDSDDDIVGEVVYNEEYLQRRKQRRKLSSSSEGDDEYRGDEENVEDEGEENNSLSASEEESDEPRQFKKLPSHTRMETKLKFIDKLHAGLRRSRRARKSRINYRQYEFSESESESMKMDNKSNASDRQLDASELADFSLEGQDSGCNDDGTGETKFDQHVKEDFQMVEEQNHLPEKSNGPDQSKVEGASRGHFHFLDLNELAPGAGYDDCPNSIEGDFTD